MGRPRKHEHAEILERALDVFWRRGYGNSSIEDLVVATGAKRSTLYRVFGSKKGLYKAAVQHYGALQAEAVDRSEGPEHQVRSWFEQIIRQAGDPGVPPGCLVINSTAEYATLDPDLQELVDLHIGLLSAWFRAVAASARPDADADVNEAVLMGANYAGFMMSLRGASDTQIRAVVETALRAVFGQS
jgi:AcrR family transcriptional regulator